MKAKDQKSTTWWWSRLLQTVGTLLILAALGCVGLLIFGLAADTGGSIPTDKNSELYSPHKEVMGPADKTLYLTIPKIGLKDIKVYDSLSEEKLSESAIHVPHSGFPWQPGANTYIAGHRLGFVGSDSFLVFLRLNELESGDEATLKDSTGKEYIYRVTGALEVPPEDVGVMSPVAGKSIISLQTCTFPDFSNRLIVQGELAS